MTLFIIAAIVGGGLVLASAFGAEHGHGDVGHDIGHDFGGGHDLDHGVDHGGGGDLWDALPFLSFRFWIFALCGFGVIGVLLNLLDAGSRPTQYVAATAGGVIAGAIVWFLFRSLQRVQSGGAQTLDSPVGRLAEVVIAVRPGDTGKVRLELGGATREYLARASGERTLTPGTPVVIVNMTGSTAEVIAFDDKEIS